MESVDSQIQALTSTNAFSDLNAGDQKNQVSDLLNNLQQDKLIQTNSVFWDNDAQAYVFSYIDGALGGVLLKKFGDDFNGSQSKDMPCTATFVDSAASPDAAASVGEALLLYSFNGIGDDQNKRDPFYVSTVSSWNSAGLQTTRDKSVTVNDLKKIDAKYDIVCFNGHGGTIDNHTVMALTEKVTSSNRQTYATDLKNQRIMIATNTYGETVYVVFPSLFTATYGASGMKNKFIFSECCCFFGENNKYNESFANAFLMAGAQAIVGFHNSVEAVYCRNFMKYWVDSLVAGKTAKQAFDTCVSKYGKDDGQPKKAAIPNFRGNNNAKLRSGSDPNNPVHTGDLIEFGSYPQRRVMDDSIIASLNALAGDNKKWTSYGYYEGSGKADGTMTAKDYMRYTDIVYNGNKYRGVIFDAYRPTGTSLVWPTVSDSKYSFLDNSYSQQYANGYRTETVYWFEFDAIEWRVLDPNSGLVMANKVLDSQPYNNLYMVKMSTSYGDESESYYANNYERSSIRQWLNNDFYNTAFSSEERKLVHTATLDNSENHSGTSYSSGTTTDKVFLLSRKETLNDAYGFSTKTSEDEIRTASGTSYARCQGLGYGGNGVYWLLRTPTVDYSGRIFVIGNRGAVHPFVGVTQSTFIGIRPAMTLAHF